MGQSMTLSAQLADMVRASSSPCDEGFADDHHGIALVAYSSAPLCKRHLSAGSLIAVCIIHVIL